MSPASTPPALIATGSALPEQIRTNEDPVFDWLRENPQYGAPLFTGYNQRRVLGPGETITSIMVAAGRAALVQGAIAPGEIDMLLGLRLGRPVHHAQHAGRGPRRARPAGERRGAAAGQRLHQLGIGGGDRRRPDQGRADRARADRLRRQLDRVRQLPHPAIGQRRRWRRSNRRGSGVQSGAVAARRSPAADGQPGLRGDVRRPRSGRIRQLQLAVHPHHRGGHEGLRVLWRGRGGDDRADAAAAQLACAVAVHDALSPDLDVDPPGVADHARRHHDPPHPSRPTAIWRSPRSRSTSTSSDRRSRPITW